MLKCIRYSCPETCLYSELQKFGGSAISNGLAELENKTKFRIFLQQSTMWTFVDLNIKLFLYAVYHPIVLVPAIFIGVNHKSSDKGFRPEETVWEKKVKILGLWYWLNKYLILLHLFTHKSKKIIRSYSEVRLAMFVSTGNKKKCKKWVVCYLLPPRNQKTGFN